MTAPVAPAAPVAVGRGVVPGPRPVISLRNVVKRYQMGDSEVLALRGITLELAVGDFVAIMGASGSGKSTLMNIIGCLDVPSRGHFWLDGVDVRTLDDDDLAEIRNRKIGFVFQSFNLLPRMSALANVELPLVYAGVRPHERRRRAAEALVSVGLGSRMDHYPSELSGGQQQRAAVARAIVTNPALILADEPTGNLDTESSLDVMSVFDELHSQGRTVVLITHEEDIAGYTERVVKLRDGLIVDDYRQDPATARGTHEAHAQGGRTGVSL
jgi:putative ABC transport system ATP-binding protein